MEGCRLEAAMRRLRHCVISPLSARSSQFPQARRMRNPDGRSRDLGRPPMHIGMPTKNQAHAQTV